MINIYSIRPKGFNIGNDVIYVGLCHFLRTAFRQPFNIITLPATSKYEAHKKSGISSQTVYEVNQFGDGIVIGGGNLYENNELEVSPTALNALDKPLMVFSVSRGKIYNRDLSLVDRTDVMTDEKIRLINGKASISLSRDRATKEYLDDIGCGDNILGGCPTLFVNEIPQHYVPVMDAEKTDALISIRSPDLMSIPIKGQYSVREKIDKIIRLLSSRGYEKVKILCHDHRDIPFAASFDKTEYLYTEDVYTYLTYLRNTRLNVTFRLHSFIPCLSYGVPSINISYDQRAASMVETMGLSEWDVSLFCEDFQREVERRLDGIGDLENLRDRARLNEWATLKSAMTESVERFYHAVKESGCA